MSHPPVCCPCFLSVVSLFSLLPTVASVSTLLYTCTTASPASSSPSPLAGLHVKSSLGPRRVALMILFLGEFRQSLIKKRISVCKLKPLYSEEAEQEQQQQL
ncbi:hypothetical protein EXN66_Car021334 [Channa argus]|uniref:Secreted protein n=1 Tax=Channa argus TaxID=215402 RepID=A0A6G1QTM2_CHAAH|nr:hypothetical protein EXN66_Car021334 [Channa argus]